MKLNKLLIGRFLIIVLLIGIVGCSSEVKEEQTEELSGTLKIGGSTTVYPISKKTAEVFMQKHPKVNITVDQSSTGEGLAKLFKGEIDIADATRSLKDEELAEAESKELDIQIIIISNDAVGVAVHKDNPLRDLSIEQLTKIFFTGEINDWSQITDGKKAGKINVYGTDLEISGTAELFVSKIYHEMFERIGFDNSLFVEGYNMLHPTPLIVKTVASDSEGIGYTPIVWIDDTVVLLTIDGVFPSDETILDNSYKLTRKMLMITDGLPTGLVREFIHFVLSSEGQKIVEEEGFIPVVEVN